MNEEREILREQIREYFADRTSSAADMPLKEMERYMELISMDISTAIGGLDSFNAPFIILILEQYVEGLRRHHPNCDEIITVLKLMCRQEEITIALPPDPARKSEEEE